MAYLLSFFFKYYSGAIHVLGRQKDIPFQCTVASSHLLFRSNTTRSASILYDAAAHHTRNELLLLFILSANAAPRQAKSMRANFFFHTPHAHGGGVAAAIQFGGGECSVYQRANLYFLLTGELPNEEVLHSLLRPASAADQTAWTQCAHMLQHTDAAAVRAAGLRAFSETAVVRVEHTANMTMMELGSSTTHTIFGGFLPEAPHAASSSSSSATDSAGVSYSAGTVLNVHLGFPGSCGSRYYILLHDDTPLPCVGDDAARVLPPTSKPQSVNQLGSVQTSSRNHTITEKDVVHSDGYAATTVVVGRVVQGLSELRAFARAVRVNTRTLAPLQRIRVTSRLVTADMPSSEDDEGCVSTLSSPSLGTMRARRRRRSESGSSSDKEGEDGGEVRAPIAQEGCSHGGECAEVRRGAVKRARTECSDGGIVSGAHTDAAHTAAGVVCDATSGLPVWTREEATRAAAAVRPVGVPAEAVKQDEPFDFFRVQGQAFAHDIDSILGVQKMKKAHHERRAAKQRVYHSHTPLSSVHAAAATTVTPTLASVASSRTMVNGRASSSRGGRGKTTRKRY